jgi:hypothetical protein
MPWKRDAGRESGGVGREIDRQSEAALLARLDQAKPDELLQLGG